MADSGGEMSRGSFRLGARVFVYLNRQMEIGGGGEMGRDGERLGKGWGKIGERLGKGWGNVEESMCGSVEVCVGLCRSVEICGGLWRSV